MKIDKIKIRVAGETIHDGKWKQYTNEYSLDCPDVVRKACDVADQLNKRADFRHCQVEIAVVSEWICLEGIDVAEKELLATDFRNSAEIKFPAVQEPPSLPLWTIVVGNPIDGFTVDGLFVERDDAVRYAEGYDATDWWVTEIGNPA